MSTALTHDDKLDRLRFYRNEVTLEWNLLQGRLNSFITSQSFLVTAYAISMGNSSPVLSVYWFTYAFPIVVSAVGLFTSLRAYPGIDGAIRVISVWRKKQNKLFLVDPSAQPGDENYFVLDEEMMDYQDTRELGKRPNRPHLRQAFALFFRRHSHPDQAQDVSLNTAAIDTIDDIHDRSLYFTRYAPKIFFYTWIVLALLTVGLHYYHVKGTVEARSVQIPLLLHGP